VVETEITYAAPHHLNADGTLLSHRKTRAGDAWALSQAVPTPRPAGTMLGLPTLAVRTS
jgi:tRNA-2-methylthio-N6-dimethylallyladenosine synthase